MARPLFAGMDKRGLRLWMLLFFLALAIPTVILIHHAYSELKWEAFHNHRVLAQELAARIDDGIQQLIERENERPFTDYTFLNVAGDTSVNFLQRSTLSAYPIVNVMPGLIGYFQIDSKGLFTTPLLPQQRKRFSAYGIPSDEWQQRAALAGRILQILSQNRLVQSRGRRKDSAERDLSAAQASQEEEISQASEIDDSVGKDRLTPRRYNEPLELIDEGAVAQQAFDLLNKKEMQENKQVEMRSKLGRIEELKLSERYQAGESKTQPDRPALSKAPAPKRRIRKREQSILPEAAEAPLNDKAAGATLIDNIRIRTFESELDPFEFSLLDSGHFVIFRKVWRNGQRYIQGMLIEQWPFMDGMIKSKFSDTTLAQMSDLILAYQGNLLSTIQSDASQAYLSTAAELTGELLYQTRLSAPLSEFDLIFSIRHLPTGTGAAVINWIALIMFIVLCGGFYLMYRMGLRQLALARQQQDFVSAVSHELKTPLTSIRMYGEMLLEGWASEEKRESYYRYIHDESERLSRLINNVLQLARMTRNEIQLDLSRITLKELIERIRAKIASSVERAGFQLELKLDIAASDTFVEIDIDCFTQILINLVDNAIKFASRADKKLIEIGCIRQQDDSVLFSVRDYGPGVQRNQMKKIFELFYRSENELTRETVGTGIGLALVHQLTRKMEGRVDVINTEPGAEFRLTFPIAAEAD